MKKMFIKIVAYKVFELIEQQDFDFETQDDVVSNEEKE